MSVTVPSSQSVGPDGHYTAPVVTKVEAPKIAPPEEGGAQPDSREQQSHYQPKDQLSQHLAVLAKRAEQMSQRQMALAQKASRDAVQQVPVRATSLSSGTSSRSSSAAPPPSMAAQSPETSSEPAADPWTLVMEKQQAYRESQPGPAEIYGLPDALARYDSNGDGRIDQTEMRSVVRAKDKDSSYAGLAQPSHPTEAELEAALQLEQPKKLYAEDAQIKDEQAVQTPPTAMLPGEKRVLEQMSGEPRRMFAQDEDPSAKVVSGAYQSISDGPTGRRSIVT